MKLSKRKHYFIMMTKIGDSYKCFNLHFSWLTSVFWWWAITVIVIIINAFIRFHTNLTFYQLFVSLRLLSFHLHLTLVNSLALIWLLHDFNATLLEFTSTKHKQTTNERVCILWSVSQSVNYKWKEVFIIFPGFKTLFNVISMLKR